MLRILASLALSLFTLEACFAAEPSAPAQVLFAARCRSCHNDQLRSGGLSLSTYQLILKGGKSGPAIVPGAPGESLLFRLVSGAAQPAMPSGGPPLSASEQEIIRQWIAQGAPWTVETEWWSLRPLTRPAVPAAQSAWTRTPIDSFIIDKLHQQGLHPSPEAGRSVLIRRLTYDLHGLPPSIEDVEAFAADPAPDAYEKLVDRLLASPRYGERWGRHWLDTVHYGESHGYDKDKPRRNAWPYRDYVIQSFNQDKPYARFVQEQLAGDVLFPDDAGATIALGFIAAGPWDFVGEAELREGSTDKKITRLLDRDDMVAVTMSSFVSMTAHCARCHNHKFDPIPQEDYYSLQSVFAGVDRADRPVDRDPAVFHRRNALLAEKRDQVAALRPFEDAAEEVSSPALIELDRQVAVWKQINATDPDSRPPAIQTKIAAAALERVALVRSALPAASVAEMDRLRAVIAQLDAKLKALPQPQMVYAASANFDAIGTFRFAIEPRVINVLGRGSVENPGKLALPGALSCVSALPSRFSTEAAMPEGARRAALAHWITAPDNMLAWRSIVNRVWHYHFGAGLVDTPNDFGRMGSLPSHPELLDWLATEFRDSGGSLKKLHKLIVMSAVYRQSSQSAPAGAAVDGENRYLWRANRQRLDAESLKDSILAVSGKLDLTMGGPSAEQFFFKDDHSPVYDYARYDPDAPGNFRRSVYRFIVRSVPDPFMERFDCPDTSMITAKRSTTITAIQALALLNNPFVLKQAGHLADRVRAAGSSSVQVRAAVRLTLQRDPGISEQQTLDAYLSREGLVSLCRLLLNTNEFLFVE